MKRMVCAMLGLTVIITGLYAEVNVAINIGPPVIIVDEPPEIVFIPDFGIYYVPDQDYEIFFYSGFWWSRRGNHWYHSRYYRSGWLSVSDREVPRLVFKVPRDYRERFGRLPHLRYQDFKKHRNHPETKVNSAKKQQSGKKSKGKNRGK
jgi:hypothetical protein